MKTLIKIWQSGIVLLARILLEWSSNNFAMWCGYTMQSQRSPQVHYLRQSHDIAALFNRFVSNNFVSQQRKMYNSGNVAILWSNIQRGLLTLFPFHLKTIITFFEQWIYTKIHITLHITKTIVVYLPLETCLLLATLHTTLSSHTITTNSEHSIGVRPCFFIAGPQLSFCFSKIMRPCQLHFAHPREWPFIFCFTTLRCITAKINEQILNCCSRFEKAVTGALTGYR